MRCLVSLVSLFFIVVLSIIAQEQNTARPNTWRGLVLDETTPDDAVRILGKPAKDTTDKLRIVWVDRWVSVIHKQKIFRRLEFKKPEGFKKADLSFLDGKLVMIDLEAKDPEEHDDWVDPDDLRSMFGTEFTPVNWGWGVKLPSIQEFQNGKELKLPKNAAEIYHMIAVSGQSIVSARVNNMEARHTPIFGRRNPGYARSRNEQKRNRDEGGAYPGAVWIIQIISRTLETQETTK